MIRTRSLALSPEGEAGEAVAEGSIGVGPLRLVAVGIDYTGVPATTDVTIKSQGRTILKRESSNTDGFFQLAGDMVDAAGAALEKEFSQSPLVYDEIAAEVAQADASAEGVIVTLYVEE
jgi:hypothetical protein